MQDCIRLKVSNFDAYFGGPNKVSGYVANLESGPVALTQSKALAARFGLQRGQEVRNACLASGWAVEQDTLLGFKILGDSK